MFNSTFQKVYRQIIAQQMENIQDIKQTIEDNFVSVELLVDYTTDCNSYFITRKNGIDLKTPVNFLYDLLFWDINEDNNKEIVDPINMIILYEWLLDFYAMIDKLEKMNKLRYGIINSNDGVYSAFLFNANDKNLIKNNIIPDGANNLIASIGSEIEFAFDQHEEEQCTFDQFNACLLIGQKNLIALKSPVYKNIFMKLNGKSAQQIYQYLRQTYDFQKDDDITIYK